MSYRTYLPRRPSDNYQTDQTLARAICQRLSQIIPAPTNVIEPSAGLGRFIVGAREQWPNSNIIGLDIREECSGGILSAGADSVFTAPWETEALDQIKGPFDLIIGNPPYVQAEEHISKAKDRLKPGGCLAFLLRMAFLSSQHRVKTLWRSPHELKYLIPLAQRPSFTEDGMTEHSEFAVYCWIKGWGGNTEILPHLWV